MILSIPCRRPWRFGSVFGSGPQGLGVRVRVAILSFRVGVLEVDGELVRYRGFSEILARHRVRDRPSGSGVSASVDLGVQGAASKQRGLVVPSR